MCWWTSSRDSTKVSEEVKAEYAGRLDEIPGLFAKMKPMEGADQAPVPPEGGEAARLETPPLGGRGAGWESVYTRNGSIITKKSSSCLGF